MNIELQAQSKLPTNVTALSTFIACACGQLLNHNEVPLCATCKVNEVLPPKLPMTVAPEGERMDGDTYPYSEGEAIPPRAFGSAVKSTHYEAEVISVLNTHTLIRSKSFGFIIRIDAGEFLEKFLIMGDRITFGTNWDWSHNPRAINIKRIEEAPRPQNTLTYVCGKNGIPEMDDSDDIDYSEEDMFALCAAAPKKNGGPAQVKFLDNDTQNTTPAKTERAIGDVVRYYNNTSNPIKEYFSGTIVDLKMSVVLNSVMYCVQPDADDRLAYFAPVWIMPYQIEGQAHLDHAYDQLPALRKIESAYVAWETAFLAGRYEEAGRLDMIHRKLEDEHHERTYGPRRPSDKIAPQTTQEGATADLEAVQAYSSTMRDPASAIANTPASRALSIRPNETHPLRVIQVGSAASKTDWEAFQVARAAQHEAAKARVEKNVNRLGGGL